MNLILKRILFYIISFTWGGIMTAIGLLVLLFTLPFGKFDIYHGRIYKEIGKNWGGVELGCFFLCDEGAWESTKEHESGHGLQNCIWGPLMPFVICIPSATRYWIFEQKDFKHKKKFVLIVFLIAIVTSLLLSLIPILTNNMWLFFIPGILLTYAIIWFLWLWFIELPKHNKIPRVGYYDIWFEDQASKWGEKYVSTDLI